MRNLVCTLVLVIFCLIQCEAIPQRRRNSGGFSSLYKNRNEENQDLDNPFDSINEPFVLDFNPPAPTRPRIRGRNQFEKVRKTDLIENLTPPKLDGEEEIFEEPIKEFEYVPPTYLENRDPPYNVTLLTLPKDDELVKEDTIEHLPLINDPRYSKFRPTRISAFGSELFYLQSRKDIENERRRQLEGAK